MLSDCCIRRLSNDMKIAIQKNYLGGHILYRSSGPSKKRRHNKYHKISKYCTNSLFRVNKNFLLKLVAEIRFLKFLKGKIGVYIKIICILSSTHTSV